MIQKMSGFNYTEVKRSCHLIIYSYQWKILFKLKVKVILVKKKKMKYQINGNTSLF